MAKSKTLTIAWILLRLYVLPFLLLQALATGQLIFGLLTGGGTVFSWPLILVNAFATVTYHQLLFGKRWAWYGVMVFNIFLLVYRTILVATQPLYPQITIVTVLYFLALSLFILLLMICRPIFFKTDMQPIPSPGGTPSNNPDFSRLDSQHTKQELQQKQSST